MTLDELKAYITAFDPETRKLVMAGVDPTRTVPTEILCSQVRTPTGYFFAVAALEDGCVGAFWEAHGSVFPDLESLIACEAPDQALNRHERFLLEMRINR